jgi:transposase
VLGVEDWAEIRRLHRAEGIPIKEIARKLGIARNTVRMALRTDQPPRYERAQGRRVVDEFEPQIRALLAEYPRMPATVVAERIRWPYTINPLRVRLREIRPEYVEIDPVDRTRYEPGQIAQCDLWFPETRIPVAAGQDRILPVLVMILGYSRFVSATMLPSRQGGDLLSGMWSLISEIGRVPKTLVWDRESAIGGTGRVSAPAAAFAGTLATRILLAPPRDPQFKGMVERTNGYLETSFLPGRVFASPTDFNEQLTDWLTRANTRTVRAIQARPVDLLEQDYLAMIPLPPVQPPIGLSNRVRLARDYYVRVDTCDYSVDPRVIGRFVDVTASPTRVVVFCEGQVVARHQRSWAKQEVITDPEHVELARQLRGDLARSRQTPGHSHTAATAAGTGRQHTDRHVVQLRALPDYDALFGVDFTTTTTKANDQ